jgi:hypothetical protein
MEKSIILYRGESIEDKTREELIEIVRELIRLNNNTTEQHIQDLRNLKLL